MQAQAKIEASYRDLWSQAAAKLKDKDRSHILHLTIDLESLRAAVEERRQECVEKQWFVPKIGTSKSKVVLRDVFAKIAFWIEKFVEVGDVAVQYDPGHAALPWALVRFLLKVSVQDVQQYAVLAEGLEIVTKVVAQYKIVEKLYLQRASEGTFELESSIVDLYTLILKFLIRAQEFYSKNMAERIFKNVFDVRNKFQGYLDAIAEQQIQVKKYADLVDTQQRKNLEEGLENLTLEEKDNFRRLRKALEDIQRPIHRMEKQLEDVHDNLESAERQKILHWLSPIPYIQHHVQSKTDILEGTGLWFLNDDCLTQWRCSSLSSIMWLRGIAGSGKSKLLSIFIEQQIAEFQDGTNPMPCYFYCARNAAELERADPAAILRSLVRQLSCHKSDGAILDPVQKVYKARERDGFAAGPLTITESKDLMIELSQFRPLSTIVIDALDECDPVLRSELFDTLTEILQSSNGLVKILVSSRNERDITCELAGCLNLEIEAKDNQADIGQFINYEVDGLIRKKRLLYGDVPDDLRHMIKQVLCEKAGGMFRWVSLQLQFLRTLKMPATVWKRLGELPTSLREIYDEIYQLRLKSYVEEEKLITKSAFKLLLSLQTPLSYEEFIQALSFCSEDRNTISAEDLLDLCFGFLVLDIELNVYRFAHLSVREYLETNPEYSSENNHALAAQLCLRYLCTSNDRGPFFIPRDPWLDNTLIPEDVNVPSRDLKHESRVMSWTVDPLVNKRQYPFLDRVQEYVCAYWANHTAGSRYLRLVHPLNTILRNFIMDAPEVVSPWFMYWNTLAIYMSRNVIGSPNLIGHQPGWHESKNKIICMTHTPADYLFTASLWGFYDLLELRLNSKPDPLLLRCERTGYNALQLVCSYGNPDAVKFLLDWGWSLQVESKLSMLSVAIDGLLVYKLGSFPDLDIDDKHIETTEILLSYGADPNEKSRFMHGRFRFSLPILKAIDVGSAELVKVLLDHGASVDVENDMGLKTFHIAAIVNKHEIADLLLAACKDVDDFARSVCTEVALIHQALRRRDETKLVIALGSWTRDPRASKYLDAALWYAMNTNASCVKALLDKGADPNAKFKGRFVIDMIPWFGRKGKYKMLVAGKFAILQLLLDHGANPGKNKYMAESTNSDRSIRWDSDDATW